MRSGTEPALSNTTCLPSARSVPVVRKPVLQLKTSLTVAAILLVLVAVSRSESSSSLKMPVQIGHRTILVETEKASSELAQPGIPVIPAIRDEGSDADRLNQANDTVPWGTISFLALVLLAVVYSTAWLLGWRRS